MGGSLLGHAHVSSESAVWHPLARVSWVGLLEHTVDLLERQALGLGDEEVGVDEGAEAERAPDEEDLRTKITLDIISYCFKLLQYGETNLVLSNHVGGNDTDNLVASLAVYSDCCNAEKM